MSQDPTAVARRFAAALDAEDYRAASGLLAETCVYRTGDGTIAGRDAVIESYRANGESAKRRFESIEYSSSVEAAGSSQAMISFMDRLFAASQSHDFHCRQHVRIGPRGLIEEIVHEELPAERQKLNEFEARLKT